MELKRLYILLELPHAVISELDAYGEERTSRIDISLKKRLLNRESWDNAIKELQTMIGDDPYGMKILWELLNLACDSYDEYERIGIPTEIFAETMKFCTRFLEEYRCVHGEYRFVWSWWFPRQLALQEFRIGCLEYEYVDAENLVYIHIPSDADLRKTAVLDSLKAFYTFRDCYFPEWSGARLCCGSWLMSPALKELLDDSSNILMFQKLFTVTHTDYESMGALDWVFPGFREVSEQLPENTSLQKNMKRYLLDGKKVGWSMAYLNEPYVNECLTIKSK